MTLTRAGGAAAEMSAEGQKYIRQGRRSRQAVTSRCASAALPRAAVAPQRALYCRPVLLARVRCLQDASGAVQRSTQRLRPRRRLFVESRRSIRASRRNADPAFPVRRRELVIALERI